MTDEEIYTSYRDAKQKGEQVKILSELTLKPVDEIIEILIKKGVPAKAFSRFKRMIQTEYIAQEEIAKCLEEKNEIIKALQDDIESLEAGVRELEAELREVTQNYTKAVEHSQELQRIIDRFEQPDKVTKTLVAFALAKIKEMTKNADV